jgi:site-specific recombinase XerD
VARYTEYLVHQRGLAPGTIRSYCDFARRFLAKLGPAWRRLGPADVIHSVESEFRRRSVSYCKHKVGELRALLRYLYVDGQLSLDLAPCVPAVAGWRLASLPQALEPEQVTRLLSGCRRGTVAGCRDRAILCLLSRLGLRAGEVAALQLEDIDWRGGELLIRGKGHSDGRLPLPRDVGQAVAAYLRKRPRVETRALFLCARAPHRPIGGHVVSDLARKGLRAIGVGSGSAHRLRHTAATQMLRAGASLSEISHVLRHRHLDTTAIYAKVDDASLRTLARPWPGGLR